MNFCTIDTLVVGSGIAGILASELLAEKNISVLIVSDTETLGGGASYFPLKATLGIQITASDNADKQLFEEDFLRTSQNIIDKNKMHVYINESPYGVNALQKIGFKPYLRLDKRPACFAKYSRPIYLIKDWNDSKKYVANSFSTNKNIVVKCNTKCIKLFSHNNTVTGALLYSNNSYTLVSAKTVILATGGIAGLYKDNLYPQDVDGSGWSLGSDIGAKLCNTEFIQFIPSFLSPKYKTLFGEHTIKYVQNIFDDKGNDIFKDLSRSQKDELFLERSAYAPFSSDFKSCLFDERIFNAISHGSNGVIFKYKKELYEDTEDFYKIYLTWLTNEQNINLLEDTIVISHFAHASNGGFLISKDAETTVQNLYALGEVSSGVEGANRMGGNSVGGIIVFTPRAVQSIFQKVSSILQTDEQSLMLSANSFLESVVKECNISALEVKTLIANTLNKNASIIRTVNSLTDTLLMLEKIEKDYFISPGTESAESYSAYHAIKASKILINSMLIRTSSIGAHKIL